MNGPVETARRLERRIAGSAVVVSGTLLALGLAGLGWLLIAAPEYADAARMGNSVRMQYAPDTAGETAFVAGLACLCFMAMLLLSIKALRRTRRST